MKTTRWAIVIAGVAAVAIAEKRNPGTTKRVLSKIRDDWYQSDRLEQRPIVRIRPR